jgi:glycosyltransferase involved in cell wall biosynthesis
MKNVLMNIDIFISPSKSMQKFFVDHGVDKSKILYSKYGFDKINANKNNKNYSRAIKFGFLGRVIPSKGIHILIKAFTMVNSQKAELHIYGSPEGYKYLKEYSNSKVFFHGEHDHFSVIKALRNIDVLIVPSLWHENSPLVIQEAFLAGIPVIASDGNGIKELVKNGINGFIFKMGDIDDLTIKIKKIINNPILINRLRPDTTDIKDIKIDAKNFISICRDLIRGK